MSQRESDTDFQRRAGLGYGRLAAAGIAAQFETPEDRQRNLEATVRLLTEENSRALMRVAELEEKLQALLARMPQDDSAATLGSPTLQTPHSGPAAKPVTAPKP